MCKYLNQVHSFQKSASWMRNVVTLLKGQILMTRWQSSILQEIQECETKICTVPVHGFPLQSSIGSCQNLEGCVAYPRKLQKECIEVASDILFACSDIVRQDSGTALIMQMFCLGSLPRYTVTRRLSASCHVFVLST